MTVEERLQKLQKLAFLNRINYLILSVCIIHLIFWSTTEYQKMVYILIIGIVSTITNIVLGTYHVSTQFRSNFITTMCYLLLLFLTLYTWNTSKILIFWLLLIPIGSILLNNKYVSLAWTIIISITVLGFYYFESDLPPKFNISVDKLHFIELNQLIGMNIIVILFIYHYGAMNRIILKLTIKRKDKFQKLQNELKATQAYKDSFFANINHELRTPINAIKGIADILSESNPAEQKRLTEILKSSSNHLLSIINDFLDISKIQAGKITFSKRPFNVKENIQDIFDMLTKTSNKTEVKYLLDFDDNIPETLDGDPLRLTQIITNILGNAIKFTSKGYVKLQCRFDRINDKMIYLNLIIKDTGIGIKYELQDQLFDHFTQADDKITMEYGGTGLGLSIAKSLIELQKGVIRFSSVENEGTEFTISIPYLVTTPKLKEETEKNKLLKLLKLKLKILLVDDNKFNLMILSEQLKIYVPNIQQLDTATNGKEALKLLESNSYDIVLLDMKMPVMDGIETTKHIRENNSPSINSIPIIMMTASTNEEDINKFNSAGANDYVSKPYELKELFDKINDLLTRKIL